MEHSPDGKTLRIETLAKNRSAKKQKVITFWNINSRLPASDSDTHWMDATRASSVGRFDIRLVGPNVELRDRVSGELALLKGHRKPIRAWHFAPDGRTLATGAGTQIKLWNLATFEEIGTLKIDTNVYKLTYLPDGTLVTADDYSEIRLWRTTTPSEGAGQENQTRNVDLQSVTAQSNHPVAHPENPEQLLEAYLATNRLGDAASSLSNWLSSKEIVDVLLLQEALRVSNGLAKSSKIDDAKRLLVLIEQATRNGISSQRLPLMQRMFMADDVRQLALYGDIAMQHLDLADWSNAERLSRECLTQYKSLEESGRFLLPAQTKQANYCLGRVLLEQGKFEEAEPLLLESQLSEQELLDGADKTVHQAAVVALEKLYTAKNR